MKKYLLGNLSESERAQIEEDYLLNKEAQEQIDLAEDELIYAYAHNELSKTEREQFEKFFLVSPRREQKLRVAKALVAYVSEKDSVKTQVATVSQTTETTPFSWWQGLLAFFQPQSRAWQFSMAALVLIFLVGGIWLVSENLRLKNQVESLQSQKSNQPVQNLAPTPKVEENKTNPNPLATPQPKNTPQPKVDINNQIAKGTTTSPTLAFTLTPITVRGGNGEGTEISITNNVEIIKLQLDMDLATEYSKFQVEIISSEGNKVWSSKQLKAQQTAKAKYVVLSLPTKGFQVGDYLIKLSGVGANKEMEDVASYPVSILRK